MKRYDYDQHIYGINFIYIYLNIFDSPRSIVSMIHNSFLANGTICSPISLFPRLWLTPVPSSKIPAIAAKLSSDLGKSNTATNCPTPIKASPEKILVPADTVALAIGERAAVAYGEKPPPGVPGCDTPAATAAATAPAAASAAPAAAADPVNIGITIFAVLIKAAAAAGAAAISKVSISSSKKVFSVRVIGISGGSVVVGVVHFRLGQISTPTFYPRETRHVLSNLLLSAGILAQYKTFHREI